MIGTDTRRMIKALTKHFPRPVLTNVPTQTRHSLCLGLTQSIDDHGLAPSCGPHHHGRVAGQHGLKHLDHFIHLWDRQQRFIRCDLELESWLRQ